jgi:hypothetical protein
MPKPKEVEELVQVFEQMYKYYHGWHFAYEHPGFFVYPPDGRGPQRLLHPDWNERGKVSIQIQDNQGEVIRSEEVPYSPPARNGVPYEMAEAYTLFRIVRPYLDANKDW